jgi:hypothetical protein
MSDKTRQVHFTMQGKGGVGKSLISAILAQYLQARHGEVACYDTDPVNDTFAQYGAFSAQRINILGEGGNINGRAFDGLMEQLLANDGVAVVDNGASTFVPLMAYAVENGVMNMLRESGREVYIHSVLTGGQALNDTIAGLTAMLGAHPAPVVVWLNEFFGDVAKDGKDFADSALYKRERERIKGLVRIERRNQDTFGKDMELMVSKKLTFDEALQAEGFGVMPRQRLKTVKAALFEQLDAIAL